MQNKKAKGSSVVRLGTTLQESERAEKARRDKARVAKAAKSGKKVQANRFHTMRVDPELKRRFKNSGIWPAWLKHRQRLCDEGESKAESRRITIEHFMPKLLEWERDNPGSALHMPELVSGKSRTSTTVRMDK